MLNDNQNSSAAWKAKLDSLDDLSDDTFDRAAAWDKLHHRLTEKPASKKFGWYWAAAACLVLMAAVGLFTTSNRQQPLVKQTTQPITPAPANEHATIKQPVATVEMKSEITIESKTLSTKKISQTNQSKNIHEASRDTVPGENVMVINDDLLTVPPTLPNKDTVAPAIATTTIVKPSYRVVHINELSKPAGPSRYARIENQSLPIKFNTKRYYPEMPVENAAQSIVSIRLSTQN